MTRKEVEKQEAIKMLRKLGVKPGATIYTKVEHVSRSGMSRRISCYIMRHNEPINITGYVACVVGLSRNHRDGGATIGGCGMDMGFHMVYLLSSDMFRGGFKCTGERCPSNDHSNGDRNRKPHHHESGGYALRQRWL